MVHGWGMDYKIIKQIKKVKVTFLICLYLFFISPIFAQIPSGPAATNYGLDPTAEGAGLIQNPATTPSVSQIIGMIINAVLAIIGVIYLVLIINAGIHWMTAGGNEETITKAKRQLINSTIGLIIIFTAFIITNFVIFTILDIAL